MYFNDSHAVRKGTIMAKLSTEDLLEAFSELDRKSVV